MPDQPVTWRAPGGWEELMGTIDAWRLKPLPQDGTRVVGGALVLVCGPAVLQALHDADPGGGQLVPPPADAASYRWIGVHNSYQPGGGWRLLEDGEPVASGYLEVRR